MDSNNFTRMQDTPKNEPDAPITLNVDPEIMASPSPSTGSSVSSITHLTPLSSPPIQLAPPTTFEQALAQLQFTQDQLRLTQLKLKQLQTHSSPLHKLENEDDGDDLNPADHSCMAKLFGSGSLKNMSLQQYLN